MKWDKINLLSKSKWIAFSIQKFKFLHVWNLNWDFLVDCLLGPKLITNVSSIKTWINVRGEFRYLCPKSFQHVFVFETFCQTCTCFGWIKTKNSGAQYQLHVFVLRQCEIIPQIYIPSRRPCMFFLGLRVFFMALGLVKWCLGSNFFFFMVVTIS